jgi:hypothetical protein
VPSRPPIRRRKHYSIGFLITNDEEGPAVNAGMKFTLDECQLRKYRRGNGEGRRVTGQQFAMIEVAGAGARCTTSRWATG